MSGHCEIERKYLLHMPDVPALRAMDGCRVWEIEQIYLRSEPGVTRRIRRVAEQGETRYYRTEKRRLSALSSDEHEAQIDAMEYASLRREADPALKPIEKTRLRIPFEGQTLEIDLYPFWQDRAILEIELGREDEPVHIPEWLRVAREVTDNKRYRNVRLAASVPQDALE